jgi:hypothetical protein
MAVRTFVARIEALELSARPFGEQGVAASRLALSRE